MLTSVDNRHTSQPCNTVYGDKGWFWGRLGKGKDLEVESSKPYRLNHTGIDSSIYAVSWARLRRYYSVEIAASKVLETFR